MKTFFSRHGSHLDIDDDTYQALWDNDLAGIHYPTDKSGWSEESDSEEIDPNQYDGSAKKSLNTMHKLAKEGGYICAVYEPFDQIKVAKVSPNSKISIFEGRWGKKNNVQGRTAKLKVIKLKQVQTLNPTEALVLRTAQPRQGTFSEWRIIGNKVKQLVEKEFSDPIVSDLTPTLQEVFCSEFLRLNWSNCKIEVPQINSLLMPVGRTMKDVDIVGLTSNSKVVVGQVTYNRLSGCNHKIKVLEKFNDAYRVLFCRNDNKIDRVKDIQVVCINKAFELFKKTDLGKAWLKQTLAT